MIRKFGPKVQVRYISPDDFPNVDDVLVEQLGEDGGWFLVISFNSMSNDYAFTEAQGVARRLAHKLAQEDLGGNQRVLRSPE